MRRWVAQHEIDTGVAASVTSDEREELRRLRPENKRRRLRVAPDSRRRGSGPGRPGRRDAW
ncbi:hypothetical protein [Streptomyces sp. NPDC001774]